MKKYSSKEYWNQYWRKETRNKYTFVFENIIKKYIDLSKVQSYIEIGGAPGSNLVYFNKKYNMHVSAIDYVDKSIIDNTMKKNGVTDYTVFDVDFVEYDIEIHKETYDFVASWGFVEHFDNSTCENLIDKHKKLVSENGYLVIELPNIRKFNWLIYKIMNPKLLAIHNLDIMDKETLYNMVAKDNSFEILYLDYYLTSFLEFNINSDFYEQHRVLKGIVSCIQTISRKLRINNIPNRFFSPYMILIAKKVNQNSKK